MRQAQMGSYLYLILGSESAEDARDTMGVWQGSHWVRGDQVSYTILSVTLAMFLMVSIASPDARAAYALLFGGERLFNRVFGFALLLSFCLLIGASMKVLFASSGDSAEFVIGATTILFIADLVSLSTTAKSYDLRPLCDPTTPQPGIPPRYQSSAMFTS